MTLSQMRRVGEHIRRRCAAERWTGWRPSTEATRDVSWVAGCVPAPGKWGEVWLAPAMVNLYDLDDYMIRPATAAHRCSWVDLLTDDEQPPTFFCSHW